jgi:mannosyltransferase OCH1-like enzyme
MNLLFKKLRKEVGWLRLQFNELPLEPLEELRHQGQCVDVSPIHTIIPMDCYLTWEENNFGKNHRKELKNFMNLNSGIRFHFFDAKDRDEYMHEYWNNHEIYKVYNRANIPIIKADIFRYCILFDRGGFYIDVNKKYPRPFKDLIESDTDFLFFYDSSYKNLMSDLPPKVFFDRLENPFINIFNGFFGIKKNHEILKNMIEYMIQNYPLYRKKVFANPKSAVGVFSGPWAFTKIIYNYYNNSEIQDKFSVASINSNSPSEWYMKGSEIRFKQEGSYAALQNEVIFF